MLTQASLKIDDDQEDAYLAVQNVLAGRPAFPIDVDVRYHHLLGHPQIVQNDMRGECELASSGIPITPLSDMTPASRKWSPRPRISADFSCSSIQMKTAPDGRGATRDASTSGFAMTTSPTIPSTRHGSFYSARDARHRGLGAAGPHASEALMRT